FHFASSRVGVSLQRASARLFGRLLTTTSRAEARHRLKPTLLFVRRKEVTIRPLVIFALGLPLMAQSLGSLIADAMKNNPEILAAQKRYEAMRQRPARESTLPDPMFSVGWSS